MMEESRRSRGATRRRSSRSIAAFLAAVCCVGSGVGCGGESESDVIDDSISRGPGVFSEVGFEEGGPAPEASVVVPGPKSSAPGSPPISVDAVSDSAEGNRRTIGVELGGTTPHRYFSARLGERFIAGRVDCPNCVGQVRLIATSLPEIGEGIEGLMGAVVMDAPWEFELTEMPEDIEIYLQARWDPSGRVRPDTLFVGSRIGNPFSVPADSADVFGLVVALPESLALAESIGPEVNEVEQGLQDAGETRRFSADLGTRRVSGHLTCDGCDGEVLVFALKEPQDPPDGDAFLALVVVTEPSDFSLDGLPGDAPLYVRARWDASGKVSGGPPTVGSKVSKFVVVDPGEADTEGVQLVLADVELNQVSASNPGVRDGSSPDSGGSPIGGAVLNGRIRCDWCSGQVLVTVSDKAAQNPSELTFYGVQIVESPWNFQFSGLPDSGTVHLRARWDPDGKIVQGEPAQSSRVSEFTSVEVGDALKGEIEIVLREDATADRFSMPGDESIP